MASQLLIALIVTLILGSIGFAYRRNRRARAVIYSLINKKLRFTTGARVTYPENVDIKSYDLIQALRAVGDVQALGPVGENYAHVLYRGFQAPYAVRLVPSAVPGLLGDENIITMLSVDFFGTATIGYSDIEGSEIILGLERIIESIDKLIESEYESRQITCTVLPDKEKFWARSQSVTDDSLGVNVNISRSSIALHSRDFSNIWRAIRTYFPTPFG